MPFFQMLVSSLNRLFTYPDIRQTRDRRTLFQPGARLSDAARALEIRPLSGSPDRWYAYLDSMPVAVAETIRQVLFSALEGDTPTEVTLAWAPGYDFEVSVWQAPDTKETRGGVTLLLRSRYPTDRHPLSG